MAFLEGETDIIADSVLTKEGTARMAAGTFKIVKYAFSDDEVDYALYDKTATTRYESLSILQTPILEAFANSVASQKYKLMTLDRQNHLYLPIFLIYNLGDSKMFSMGNGTNTYVIMVDKSTVDAVVGDSGQVTGCMDGTRGTEVLVRVDQGLDTQSISRDTSLDAGQIETQWTLQMDNLLGYPVTPVGNKPTPAKLSFVDDNNIATYPLTAGSDSTYIGYLPTILDSSDGGTAIDGPTGTRLSFRVMSSIYTRTSQDAFSKFGAATTVAYGSLAAGDAKEIVSTITCIGEVTGYRLDIPIKYIKKT